MKYVWLVSALIVTAGCKEEATFTKAEKETYFENCLRHGGRPSIFKPASRGDQLLCVWTLPEDPTVVGLGERASVLFQLFDNRLVRDDGLWINPTMSQAVFSLACQKIGGQPVPDTGDYSGCQMRDSIYTEINLAVAFGK